MGIYDSTLDFAFPTGAGKSLPMIAAAVIGALLLIALLYFGFQAVKPGALDLRFDKNPIMPTETTKLIVKVTNITEQDAANVTLSVGAKEANEFEIYPLNNNVPVAMPVVIPSLSAQTSREVTFSINPIGSKLPGTYVMVARVSINGVEHQKEI